MMLLIVFNISRHSAGSIYLMFGVIICYVDISREADIDYFGIVIMRNYYWKLSINTRTVEVGCSIYSSAFIYTFILICSGYPKIEVAIQYFLETIF